MTTNLNDSVSGQVYLSRDRIRTQLSDQLKYFLKLDNIDLTKSSFVSYLVNVLSSLTSNLLFYQTSNYREFFLTTAKLPESVYNLSAFLGYNTREASYASTYVLMTIPFGFDKDSGNASITLADGFKFYAKDIEFRTYYETQINVTSNSYATVTLYQTNKSYLIPVSIDTTSSDPGFSFLLPVRQYKENIQEFQVDSDLRDYQFLQIPVPIEGKVSSLSVQVRAPNSSLWVPYTEFQSLYLMSSSDYGFVSRRTDTGRTVYFGNNLIGIRPDAGATIQITVNETEGLDGNVLSRTINKGQTIYQTLLSGQIVIVNYSVINTSAATGGLDEESTDEIKTNAIAALTSLGRFVSEDDYTKVDNIITSSPFSSKSISVLKRSDLKINEVQFFTELEFDDDIVPTRNGYLTIPTSQTTVDSKTVVTLDSEQFYTLFEIEVDNILNKTAYYNYLINDVNFSPTLSETNTSNTFVFQPETVRVYKTIGSTAVTFIFSFTSTETTKDLCTCKMKIEDTEYNMTNYLGQYFTYTFPDYTSIPSGELLSYFTVYDSTSVEIAKYYIDLTVRKKLDSFMLSNISVDSTSATIYDVPCVKKSYYDALSAQKQKDFELVCMQGLLNNVDFTDYRMLTDFTNLKFMNTCGKMRGMLYNETTRDDVDDIYLSSLPANPLLGSRYIITGSELGMSRTNKDKIIECASTSPLTWTYTTPIIDDIVYVTNKNTKYIYSDSGWIEPLYDIPLVIEAEIVKTSTYSGSDVELAATIRETLVSDFEDRFGPNISLYRSEITKSIQSIDGVDHCKLIKPESDIYFNFDLKTLLEDELLEYGPDYIYFDENSITLRIS